VECGGAGVAVPLGMALPGAVRCAPGACASAGPDPPVRKLGGMGNEVSVDLRSNRVASWDQLPNADPNSQARQIQIPDRVWLIANPFRKGPQVPALTRFLYAGSRGFGRFPGIWLNSLEFSGARAPSAAAVCFAYQFCQNSMWISTSRRNARSIQPRYTPQCGRARVVGAL
jgi:hypothetical protein